MDGAQNVAYLHCHCIHSARGMSAALDCRPVRTGCSPNTSLPRALAPGSVRCGLLPGLSESAGAAEGEAAERVSAEAASAGLRSGGCGGGRRTVSSCIRTSMECTRPDGAAAPASRLTPMN